MGDVESIGVIIDDTIDVLEQLYNDTENDCYKYTIKVLEYINFLCDEQFINLDMKHELDNEEIKLIDIHRKCI